jgi:hypothetical protein
MSPNSGPLVNALDERAKISGVVIYRIDATKSGARTPTTRVRSSRKNSTTISPSAAWNLPGWRPIDNRLDGYDSRTARQPGDVDPATGVDQRRWITLRSGDPRQRPWRTTSRRSRSKERAGSFPTCGPSNARLKGLTVLTFDTASMQMRPANQTAAADEPRYYVQGLDLVSSPW